MLQKTNNHDEESKGVHKTLIYTFEKTATSFLKSEPRVGACGGPERGTLNKLLFN